MSRTLLAALFASSINHLLWILGKDSTGDSCLSHCSRGWLRCCSGFMRLDSFLQTKELRAECMVEAGQAHDQGQSLKSANQARNSPTVLRSHGASNLRFRPVELNSWLLHVSASGYEVVRPPADRIFWPPVEKFRRDAEIVDSMRGSAPTSFYWAERRYFGCKMRFACCETLNECLNLALSSQLRVRFPRKGANDFAVLCDTQKLICH